MGADGWLGVGWPKEYGGQGRSPIEQFIFFDEAERAGAPVPMLTINTVGPTIMRFGTEEQKRRFLPGILARRDPLRDRLHRARRRHRPRVAEDTRRARRRRVRHQRAEDLHQPGRRTPTTSGSRCAPTPTRRSTRASRSSSSPTDTPGFSFTPDPVRRRRPHQRHVLRGRARAGRQPRRRGERGLEAHHEPAQPRARRAVQRRRAVARTSTTSGAGRGDEARRRPARDRPAVGAARTSPACTPKLEVLRLMNWQRGVGADAGRRSTPPTRRPMKVFGTEFYIEALPAAARGHRPGRLPQARARPAPCCTAGSSGRYSGTLILTFGGGTNEVQRDIIAMAGLGMPRAPR